MLEIRRQRHLDLTVPESLYDDSVNTYVVELDGRTLGTLEHRYGDGPWMLVNKATALVAFRPSLLRQVKDDT